VIGRILIPVGLLLALPGACLAQDSLDTGDTAWILTATALVLFMTIPGLAMFYAGLVKSRNVLSMFMQCFAITALVTVLWVVYGYSLAFDGTGMAEGQTGLAAFVGGFGKLFLSGVSPDSISGTIPELTFVAFQLTFAIITPAHMVWGGAGGYFADMGVFDFAGGIVVHITAGFSALVACILVGRRQGHPERMTPPHNIPMTLAGTAMLWVGWFGFNGGSALAANGQAAMAILVTQISPCVAAMTWISIERIRFGQPTAVGLATGAIAGLAAITPASGNVGPMGAIAIGLAAGLVCYWASVILKARFGYDDALDVVGVHGVGGLVGTLLVAVFASAALGGAVEGLDIGAQLGVQAFASIAVAAYCMVVSFVILKVLDAVIGLRVTSDEEASGLDIADHGETGYAA